jgi:flagellum-specific peptidoglycan hydrolase FlgJ
MLTDEQKENLKLMAEAAVASERATGCPAEVSVAQCILESGWLKVAPGNNCFGIKDTDRYPGAQYLLTKEYINGEWQTLRLAFEAYPTLADCFTDHARLITGGFIPSRKNCYGAAFEAYKLDGDLDKFIRGIA